MGVIRGLVVIMYIISFFVALSQIASVWSLIEYNGSYVQSAVVFMLLVSLCGVLMSLFVYVDGQEIDRLREFTGLAQHEKEELVPRSVLEEPEETLEKYTEATVSDKEIERVDIAWCETCAFFGKPALCPLREKNPMAVACAQYRKKS